MTRPSRSPAWLLLAGMACIVSAPTMAQAPQPATTAQVPGAPSATIEKTSFLYATKDGQKLYLDRIVDSSVKVDGKRPVIIHSVGGGWEAGLRDDKGVTPFLNYLATLGYTVISIDYRLGIKAAKERKEMTADNGTEMYLRAVRWGVEDLFEATSYVLKQADAWNLDKNNVVILGGSAGAVNSLVAEFNLANGTEMARKRLPENFRYSGVIAMAGAFWLKPGTPLEFKSKPAPIMFFHGGKDQLVTYDEAQAAGVAAYGPVAFMRKFPGPDYPKWFVDYPQADHAISATPMIDQRKEIAAFLQKLVKERQQASIHTIQEDAVPKTLTNFFKIYGDRIFTGAEGKAPELPPTP